MPIGDAAEVLDTLYAYYRIREEYQVVVAGPERRVYPLVMHEIPKGWDITRESPGYHLQSEVTFSEVVPDDYCGLFLTGGRAPEYLRYNSDLLRIVHHFFEAGKPVCVVCHGVEILAAARVIAGRRMATVAKCQLDIELCGAVYVNEACVRDGNLVSGRTWNDQHRYMPEFIRMVAEEVERNVATQPALAIPRT
jgi:protease I